jgi:hypothetical protein
MSAPNLFPHYSGAGSSRALGGSGSSTFDLEALVRIQGGHKTGPNKAMVNCVGHDDHTPSMSAEIRNGKLLVKCFAGCSQEAVIRALKDRGLWPENERRPHRLAVEVGDVDPKVGTVVATYDYTDATGELLYRILRFNPKDFRPRRPDGQGGWIAKGPSQEELVLYRMTEVAEAPIIFVCEGEKDCESLRGHGFVATTPAFGARYPWQPQFTEALVGREVILVPDNDAAGQQHLADVARALLGKAARLRWLHYDGVKDISEWFAKGHSELELIAALDPEEVTR